MGSDRAFLGFSRKQQWLAGRAPFGRAQRMGVAAFESTFAFFFSETKLVQITSDDGAVWANLWLE